jgi:diaminohydroxyphosphoribosylaminopyrimidine deaminase/5-amino-6-(5-phosphoribosylamino)uracil reductase
MRRALTLARRARGRTSPNPLVGAVIVRRGRIVGKGFHRRVGEAHAEVAALRQAGASARGATLYVTLEPCNHHGRTPPCCDAILKAGIARVVAAMRDPNPVTNGRGLARLRRAGVRVRVGVLEADARELNAAFCKTMRTGLPLVLAKIGQSLDGKIATARGRSRWITSPRARAQGHALRHAADAVLVGLNTVLQDNPRLSARGDRARAGRPVKVIVDSQLRTPPDAACLSANPPAPTIIATTVDRPERRAVLEERGAQVLRFSPRRGRVPLRALLRVLARRGLQSVLIEGGGEVLASALAQRLVDRIIWFVAPVLIGGRRAPSSVAGEGVTRLAQAPRLDGVRIRRVGPDLRIEGRVIYPGRRASQARGRRQAVRGRGPAHVYRHRA